LEPRVSRAVQLAHPARRQWRKDLVGAEAHPRTEAHIGPLDRCESALRSSSATAGRWSLPLVIARAGDREKGIFSAVSQSLLQPLQAGVPRKSSGRPASRRKSDRTLI